MSIRPILVTFSFFYDFYARSSDLYVNYFSKIKVTLMSILKLQVVTFMSRAEKVTFMSIYRNSTQPTTNQ